MKTKSYLKEVKKEFPKYDIKEANEKYIVTSPESNFSYFIDPANGVVIVKLREYCDSNISNLIDAYVSITKDNNSKLFKKALEYANSVGWEYRGKAKCHSDDKFDLKFGIKLGRNRVLHEYNKQELIRNGVTRQLLARMDQALSKKQLTFLENMEKHPTEV